MANNLKIRVHERRTPHPSENPLNHKTRPAPKGYVDMYNSMLPVYVSKDIFPASEYDLEFGDRKDELVSFRYYNVLDDRYSRPINLTYHDALELGLQRAKDMRYKNFEFYIDLASTPSPM